MAVDERVVVKTTVPSYQKAAWVDHAEALDMSQSEFVATMVQAGRRGFDPDPPETPSADVDPRGTVLRERVLEALSREEQHTFDELVEIMIEDLERRLEVTVDALRDEGLVDMTTRGKLVLVGSDHGDD